jgi:hypothetical protein
MRKAIMVALATVGMMVISTSPVAAQMSTAEQDRYWQTQAANACRNGEFGSFWGAFVSSAAVRAQYSAASIRHGRQGASRPMARAAYARARHFPVAMVDGAFISADSAGRIGRRPGPDYLELEINQASTGPVRVDWSRRRGGNFEGMDSPPAVERFGRPGYLLFVPTATCWALSEDIR